MEPGGAGCSRVQYDETMHVCPECGGVSETPAFCPADGTRFELASDPILGTDVLRYRVARLLGEGGMGKVYLAVQPHIGSRVAIKILSPQSARSPELLERFFAEGRAVNLIRHENIVSVIDMAQLEDGRPLIVMEYIDGKTLGALVRAGRVPLGGLVRVFGDVLSALHAAHAIGIVHRDVKPDNVLVTAKGNAKVLDFGIAKLAPQHAHDLSPRTRTGALLGTPSYMAPEQISGAKGIDARTDVYAAGVMLFEAVTGKLPFAGATMFDLMRAHVEDAPPRPTDLRPDLPPGFEDVILTALAKDPARRFQSAAAMANALETASGILGSGEWRAASTGDPAPRSRRGTARPETDLAPVAATIRAEPIAASPGRRSRALPVAIGLGVAALVATGAVGGYVALRGGGGGAAPIHDGGARIALVPVDAAVAVPAPGDAAVPRIPASPSPSPPAVDAAPQTAFGPPPRDARTVVVIADAGAPKLHRDAGATSASAPHGDWDEPVPPPPPPPRPVPAPGIQPWQLEGNPPDPYPLKRSPVTYPAPSHATRFDYLAFAGRATALARKLAPDARLVQMELYDTFPDGHVDLARATNVSQFSFISASRAGDKPCEINVDVSAAKVEVYFEPAVFCDRTPIGVPGCPLTSAWERARELGAKMDHAGASYRAGRWSFSSPSFNRDVEDDCGPKL